MTYSLSICHTNTAHATPRAALPCPALCGIQVRMKRLYIQQAYTDNGQGGNGAGVVVHADGMDGTAMQAVAHAVGLSETAFVTGLSTGSPTVRYFTPVAEVPLCGHATVAAWTVLLHLGLVAPGSHRQGLKKGEIDITLEPSGAVWMEQKLPCLGDPIDAGVIAPIFGLSQGVFSSTGLPVQGASTGLMDIMVPVPSCQILGDITPDFSAMAAFNEATDTVGFHLFCLEPRTPGHTACCRNFAPRYGIDEESATGSASGALAAYLHTHGHAQRHCIFEQGHTMGSPSRIDVVLESARGKITGVRVGGYGGTPVQRPFPQEIPHPGLPL